MKIVSETTKNYIYEKMADLIMMFLENYYETRASTHVVWREV
jgi:hypothetical protein